MSKLTTTYSKYRAKNEIPFLKGMKNRLLESLFQRNLRAETAPLCTARFPTGVEKR